MHNSSIDSATAALTAYGLQDSTITRLDSGLINHSFLVQSNNRGDFILQAVSPMFSPLSMTDIDHITACLDSAGILTPRLIRTRKNRLFTHANGHLWRLYNRIHGETRHRLSTPDAAHSAGVLLADIHQALAGLDYRPCSPRPDVHDTARHIDHLQQCLKTHADHPAFGAVEPLAQEILAHYQHVPRLPVVPARLVHGDPKISNFLYAAGTETAICMVDFDTFGDMPLCLEIGDALRSWANPEGEDTAQGRFLLDTAVAALSGYASRAKRLIRPDEWRPIATATQTVYIELAARFCADALTEDYFGWDEQCFQSHSEHSQVRARGQLNAALSLQAQRHELQTALADVFAA